MAARIRIPKKLRQKLRQAYCQGSEPALGLEIAGRPDPDNSWCNNPYIPRGFCSRPDPEIAADRIAVGIAAEIDPKADIACRMNRNICR